MSAQEVPSQISFASLNREDLAARASDALLVIPVGATEQHGPGLPTGTDTFHAESVALAAAQKASRYIDIVVAPVVAYGCSEHHLPFGATLSVGSRTLLMMLSDLGKSAVRSGFRRIFYLNGHGGNHEIVQLAARDLALAEQCHAGGGSWWDMAREPLMNAGASNFPRVPGHAGAFEAAILSTIHPHLIHPEKYNDKTHSTPTRPSVPYRAEFAGFWSKIDGYSDDPTASDLSGGDHLFEVAADSVAGHLVEFHETTHAVEHW